MNIAKLFLYIVIGFAAQMIDGTLGMAYGVSCRTFLRTVGGLPSAIASAVVHCSEVPTTPASGISHWRIENVSWKLFFKLLIPVVIGGFLDTWFRPGFGDRLESFIDVYLTVMGIVIFCKAFREKSRPCREPGDYVYPLVFIGGFLDAAG